MHIILLSGGSGKRVWPLSNDVRSKQFLSLIDDQKGGHESMLKRVYRQIRKVLKDVPILIASGEAQYEQILGEVGGSVEVVLEPARRDTFPAIALSCSYLSCEKHVSDDEIVLVLPVDVFADLSYFEVLSRMADVATKDIARLVLMGIKPSHPASSYGYIQISEQFSEYALVKGFVEKPTVEVAQSLIDNGSLWNGGVFAFKLGYLMEIAQKHFPGSTYRSLLAQYGSLEKISFDYAVVEKTDSLAMVSYDGMWKDLGSWDTLTQEMGSKTVGQAVLALEEPQTSVVNELDIPVVALGTNNLVIAASLDGILVADRRQCASLKKHVESLSALPRFESLRWGTKKVLLRKPGASSVNYLTIKADAEYGHTPESDVVLVNMEGTAVLSTDQGPEAFMMLESKHIKQGQAYQIQAETELHVLQIVKS